MVIRIRSGRHPHEVALLAAAFLMGVAGVVIFDTVASTTVRALPQPWGHVMYGVLAIGSAIALTGVFWPGIAGAVIERAGLVALVGASLGYAVAIFAINGPRGLAFTTFLTAFALANVFRAVQISKEITEMQAAAVILRDGEGPR